MKRVLAAIIISGAALILLASLVFMLFVGTEPFSKAEFIEDMVRLKAFRYTGLVNLDEAGVKTLYQWSCVGRCHGAAPVETARHTSREWRETIDRMRIKNGADVNEKERDAIAGYLRKNYGSNVPTILSPEANRYLKKYLWKSDFGESDLYVDIIYSPKEFFELMGEYTEMKRYGAGSGLVFKVYLNTHQGKLERWDIKTLAAMRFAGGELKPLDWTVLYESGDLHHMEGVLRFHKTLDPKDGFMEIILRDLPGQKERAFRWELPIPEPAGLNGETNAG